MIPLILVLLWHVSIAPMKGSVRSVPALFLVAERVLAGVGDRFAGEWREVGIHAVHLRRRLTAFEASTIDPVCDIRGTADARRRVEAIRRVVPSHVEVGEY